MNIKAVKTTPDKYLLLNVPIDNWTFDDFVAQLEEGVVLTPNSDHLAKLQKDKAFYDSYIQAEHLVCDSKVLILLSRFLTPKSPIKEQIAGSDLFPAYCAYHANNTETKVFLLGGSEESVSVAMNNINHKTNSNVIVGAYSPPFGFENSSEENDKIIDKIQASGANVLAVGVGAPKQEKWIFANRDKLPSIRLFFAIGATIEFEAGGLSRAPRWMSNNGIEWLYRLFQEPKRMFKRYVLEDTVVLWLALKQKLGLYKNPWS